MNLSRDFSPMWQNMDVVGLVATPTLVDLTGDGLPDIVVVNETGNINLFENTGSATNPQYPSTPTIQKLGLVDTRLLAKRSVSAPPFLSTRPPGRRSSPATKQRATGGLSKL